MLYSACVLHRPGTRASVLARGVCISLREGYGPTRDSRPDTQEISEELECITPVAPRLLCYVALDSPFPVLHL